MRPTVRRIIHVDMDAFYASVEQRDRPAWRGRPLIVGGSPQSRAVVCAASYEARRFGVRSAMPCATAAQRCPQAIFTKPDFGRYRAVSRQVQAIFHRWTDQIEPIALDEAFLDVTVNKQDETSATRVAQAIRTAITTELRLVASAGVSSCKLVAKIASDIDKPDGLRVVPPAAIAAFLAPLPVRRLPGIGPKAERRCHRAGISTLGELRQASDEVLTLLAGNRGEHWRELAWGRDDSPVRAHRQRKSIGIEDTFATDVNDLAELEGILDGLIDGLIARAERHGRIAAGTITLKIRFKDFSQRSRSHSFRHAEADRRRWRQEALALLRSYRPLPQPVRLLGVSLSRLDQSGLEQLTLTFDEEETAGR